MSLQGKKLTQEEISSIRDMLEKGMTGKEIGEKLGRSTNSVCWHIRENNLCEYQANKKRVRRERIPLPDDYSKLPETILFSYKDFNTI